MATAPAANVTRYQGDLQNPDTATAQTVELMCGFINRTARDPWVQAAARDAVRRFRGGPLYALAGIDPMKSADAQAESVWWWSKHALQFVHHDGLIQLWLNERQQLQLLIAPDLLLRMDKPRGDCAIYTMLCSAMLKALGLPYELVTAAVTPDSPDLDHVWTRAVLPDGRRLNLDASHGKYPGWQVPFEHRNRTQIWDETGTPVPDAAPRPFRGLHSYTARPTTPMLPRRLALVPGVTLRDYQRFQRGFGRYRGLGQDGQSVTVLDPSVMQDPGIITNPAGYPVSTPVSVSGPGFNWQGTLGNLLNQWTQIAGNVIAPRNTIRTGPQGTSVDLAAGSSLPAGAFALPGAVGGIGMGTLVIGGVVVVALFMALGKR